MMVWVWMIRKEYPKLFFGERTLVDPKEILLRMWREQAKMYPMQVRIEKQKELTLEEKEESLKVEIKKVTVPQSVVSGKP